MKLIAVLFLLCSSCVHYNIHRVGRHEKTIEVIATVPDKPERERLRLARILVRKAKLLGCDKLTYTKIEDDRITGLCEYKH